MDLDIVAVSTESDPSSEAIRLVVHIIDGMTTVVEARPQDTLGELLSRFVDVGSRNRSYLHAMYHGQNLPLGATIGELGLPRDATLHLTPYPGAWSLACQIAAGETSEYFAHNGKCLIDPLALHLGPSDWPASLAFDNVAGTLYYRDTVLLIQRFLGGANTLCNVGRIDMAVEYLGVLLSSGVASFLVSLYVSTSPPHHDRGKSAIICLVCPEITIAPSSQLGACLIPLCLEFCRLIPSASGKGRSDPLYEKCRSRLAAMLSLYEGVRTSSRPLPRIPQENLIKQLIPIAKEATEEAIGYMAQGSMIPANKRFEFRVFFKFMCYFRRLEVGGQPQRADSLPDDPVGAALTEAAESLLISVHLFMNRSEGGSPSGNQMLGLAATKEHDQQQTVHSAPLPSGEQQGSATKAQQHQQDIVDNMWVVLGQLDLWSETSVFFAGVMRTMCEMNAAYLSALVLGTSAGRSRCFEDIGRVVVRHKDLLGFEVRRHFAAAMLADMDPFVLQRLEMLEYDGPQIVIDRSRLLADSFRHVSEAASNVLHSLVSVEFLDEEAIGEGVMREWLILVFQELFDPRRRLFSPCPRDRRRFFLNPASGADPLDLKYLDFAGRMMGLALMHNIQVGVRFDRTLFFELVGRPLTLDDIGEADPRTHASYKEILEMDPKFFDSANLCLTFAREVDGKVIELLPGGRDIAVDSKNRGQYIHLLIQNSFVTSTKDQLAHFAKGFGFMLAKPELQTLFFRSLHLKDLDNMLGGSVSTIDVQEWKQNTIYDGGFTEQNDQIKWFWKVVASMTAEEQRRLIFFWTSVDYLPYDGFGGLGLGYTLLIYKASSKTSDHLPSSSTCIYRLNLPVYTSFAMTLSRLQKITQEHVSNSFGLI